MSIILIFTIFFIKHFVVDFLYQPPYMWKNKGTYGHMGGIVHAGLHGITTLLILLFFYNPIVSISLALLEAVIHYHIDWFKMYYGAKKGWKADTHEEFWILMGLDQLLHYLTYSLIILLATMI